MGTWFRALHMRQRYLAQQRELVTEMAERLHRLEIARRELHERMELLESSQDKLMARFKGDRGGRPRKDEPSQLDMIPAGDKAGLRKYFGIKQ